MYFSFFFIIGTFYKLSEDCLKWENMAGNFNISMISCPTPPETTKNSCQTPSLFIFSRAPVSIFISSWVSIHLDRIVYTATLRFTLFGVGR